MYWKIGIDTFSYILCFPAKVQVNKSSSQQYDGLSMDDRAETTNVPSVYRDLQRNTVANTGNYKNNVALALSSLDVGIKRTSEANLQNLKFVAALQP